MVGPLDDEYRVDARALRSAASRLKAGLRERLLGSRDDVYLPVNTSVRLTRRDRLLLMAIGDGDLHVGLRRLLDVVSSLLSERV